MVRRMFTEVSQYLGLIWYLFYLKVFFCLGVEAILVKTIEI